MCSMPDGDALTAVEHLEFPEFAIEGGENVIFTILEARYPDKDPIDRAGKALFDVFENVWFHACQRDAGIALPDMVKGYLCATSMRAVGRSARSGAGTHRRQVRNCGNCTCVEIMFS